MNVSQIKTLLKKDFTLEKRQKYSFFSVLLYVVSTTYIAYLIFGEITDFRSWNALFWIILLFGSISTASRSFAQETGGRYFYYHQLFLPQSIILSKLIYNGLLTTTIAATTYGLFSLLLGNPVKNQGLFLLALFLGAWGLSGVLTLVAAIASKAEQNATTMAILSLPLLLPLILVLVEISNQAIFGLGLVDNMALLGVISALNLMVVGLAFLLFPYIWRD